jgi:hypothetical protein
LRTVRQEVSLSSLMLLVLLRGLVPLNVLGGLMPPPLLCFRSLMLRCPHNVLTL